MTRRTYIIEVDLPDAMEASMQDYLSDADVLYVLVAALRDELGAKEAFGYHKGRARGVQAYITSDGQVSQR